MPGPVFALGSLTYIADLNVLSNGLFTVQTQTVNFAAAKGYWHVLKNDAVTATLPLAPAAGDRIRFSAATTSVKSVTLARNGSNINSAAADLTLRPGFELTYVDAAIGWRVDRAIPTGPRNLVINGGFTVNQRGYVSAAVLGAGAYGHDRWKAGAGGGDYSFAQLAHNTTITIAANKTLIQVIEDKMVTGGTYVLSWSGTSQARVGINTATPAGAYVNSPIVISGQNAGATMSIEFGNGAAAGTLTAVQLEVGQDPTDFELRPFSQELALSQRYYEKSYAQGVAVPTNTSFGGQETFPAGAVVATATIFGHVSFKVTKRVAATVRVFSYTNSTLSVVSNLSGADAAAASGSVNMASDRCFQIINSSGGNITPASGGFMCHWDASAEL